MDANITSFYQPMVVAPFFLTIAMTFALYRDEVATRQEERPTLLEEETAYPPSVESKMVLG